MNSESERELAVVLFEEKAKVVLGAENYTDLAYVDWVEELKSFVQTQRCADCGASYDLEYPEEEIWGWFVEGQSEEMEELEVVEFMCLSCVELEEDEREASHPKTQGTLIFRRGPTGTFPLDEEDEDAPTEDDEL